jgi:ParB/RepB/Spo0J family partition protein
MIVTDQFVRLPLTDVFVARDDRQRRAPSTKGLIESIRTRGVLNPIIVERSPSGQPPHRLVAGERRLLCSKELGLPDIPARFLEDLNPIEAQIVELEENIKRQDLEWQEIVQTVGSIHSLYCKREPTWTHEQTAEALGLTRGTVSLYMRVFADLNDERVRNAGTVREAFNLLTRRDSRQAAEQLQGIVDDIMGLAPVRPPKETSPEAPEAPSPEGPSPAPMASPALWLADPARSILHESFIHWAPKYTGRKFNLIHCDFPYGIEAFAGPQMSQAADRLYDDSASNFFKLLECLCTNLDRLLSLSGHLMFWYSERNGKQMREMFAALAPELALQLHPLIWVKSDNSGVAPDSRHGPRHIYETCLLATRGKRQIVRVVGDAYSCPTDKAHSNVSVKPEPMLRHFMSMLVDEHTVMLDPTCGLGSALRAAESLGASYVLGMDTDEQVVGQARMLLRQSRSMRLASKHSTKGGQG